MNLYSNKQRWKQVLLFAGVCIIGLIIWLTSVIANNVKKAEIEKVQLWSQAIKKKAELVRLTNDAFNQLASKESEKVRIWAQATKELEKPLGDYGFALQIIQNNKDIPLILRDGLGHYVSHKNMKLDTKNDVLIDSLCTSWGAQNSPIEINYFENRRQKIFYTNSFNYFKLEVLRDSLLDAFSDEIMNNIAQLPVIFWSDEGDSLIASNTVNFNTPKDEIVKQMNNMVEDNLPIEIVLGPNHKGKVFYNNSAIFYQLQYFPILSLAIVALFLLVSYLSFSSFRKAEQNQVWAGMAKETAHQLGTPLSSLQGWITLLKEEGVKHEAFNEMEKDINRLSIVSDRFSKIGSKVEINSTNMVQFFHDYIEYMKKRIPSTIELKVSFSHEEIFADINPSLFSWVIENLLKNAADAMRGKGVIEVQINKVNSATSILVIDSGKGIQSHVQKNIFEPGYTTKDRGWGLGLSLVKRIVEGHHGGKVSVKSSKLGKGTTFEVVLPKHR